MRWQLEELAGPGPKSQERRTEQTDGEEGGAQPGKESLKKVSWQGWELPAQVEAWAWSESGRWVCHQCLFLQQLLFPLTLSQLFPFVCVPVAIF